jgi:hypothetical protein
MAIRKGERNNAKNQAFGIRGTQGSGIQAETDTDSGQYGRGSGKADRHQLLRSCGESDPQSFSYESGSERIGGIISQLINECREHVNALEGQLASQKTHLQKLESLFQELLEEQDK